MGEQLIARALDYLAHPVVGRREAGADSFWVEQKDSVVEALKHVGAGRLPDALATAVLAAGGPQDLDGEAEGWLRGCQALIAWVLLTWARDEEGRAWISPSGPPLALRR